MSRTQVFQVGTAAELATDIAALITPNVTYTIQFTASITLDRVLSAIVLGSGSTLTIEGNGFTLNGGGTYQGFFIDHGGVAINDLTLASAVAHGGNGGSGNGGGGGGAGLGGGLYIGSAAAVTLRNVSFLSDQAVGGNGGGGLGAGGDIFVQQGGTLIIEGGTLSAGAAQGGAAGNGSAGPGRGYGSGIFLQGTQAVSLNAAVGQVLSITDVIADMTGSADPSGQIGIGSLSIGGSGTIALGATNTYGGGTTINGTATLSLAASGAAGSGAIDFAGTAVAQLVAADASMPGNALPNAIHGFNLDDAIDLTGLTYTGSAGSYGTAIVTGGTLVASNTVGATRTLLLSDVANGTTAYLSNDGSGGTLVTLFLRCFAAGTPIETPDGSVAVERLKVGDLVLTEAGGHRPIVWAGHRRVDCRRHPDPGSVWPVLIKPHAFAEGQPRQAVLLSPDHAVHVDGVLIPIRVLINGDTIVRTPVDVISYHHIELGSHDIVLADGLPVETYLHTGDRDSFAGGAAVRLWPDFGAGHADNAWRWEVLGYAPLLTRGAVVERVRRTLAERARWLRSRQDDAAAGRSGRGALRM